MAFLNITESLKPDQNTIAISAILPSADNFKEKVTKVKRLAKNTAKNTVISPTFMVWKFYRKAQFLHSFGRITQCRNCAFP